MEMFKELSQNDRTSGDLYFYFLHFSCFPGGAAVKNLPANAGDTRDMGSIPGSGRFPWRRKWQPNSSILA